jgi:hypothetical protein
MGCDVKALDGTVVLIDLGARLTDPVFRFGQTTPASSPLCRCVDGSNLSRERVRVNRRSPAQSTSLAGTRDLRAVMVSGQGSVSGPRYS